MIGNSSAFVYSLFNAAGDIFFCHLLAVSIDYFFFIFFIEFISRNIMQ